MKSLIPALLLATLLSGCGQKETTRSTDDNSSGNPLSAPADYLGAVSKAQKTAVKTVDIASLKSAIAMFNASEEHYPKDLNELAQKKYIPEIPAAPAGSRYEYNAQTGDVKLVRQ